MPLYWIILFSLALIGSAIEPQDRLNWFLEASPALGAFLVLLATQRQFRLTPLSYALLLVLCLVILIGAHFSFHLVPGFEWLQRWLGTDRNNFDKFAHLFQGMAPAIVFREVLIRFGVVAKRPWLWLIVPALCLALSASYELVEWWTSLLLRERAENFLAIQGDPWDAQSDMASALVGALAGLIFFSRRHDRQIREAERASPPGSMVIPPSGAGIPPSPGGRPDFR